MSAMAKMLADIILKEVPQEIKDALTPENIARVQQNVSNLLVFYKQSFEDIKVEQQEQRLMLERIMENVGNGNSGKPARTGGARKLTGDGIGSD